MNEMAAAEPLQKPTQPQIEALLYAALAESRGCSPDELGPVTGAGGVIDSLEGVELVAASESSFGVTVKDRELTASVCRSVPRLAALISSKLS